MARPISKISDDQIIACIAQLEAEGVKLTISAVSERLHVRRNRVQPFVARRRAEIQEEQALQARTGPTVAELRAENAQLKQKISELETYVSSLRRELRELRASKENYFNVLQFEGLSLLAKDDVKS